MTDMLTQTLPDHAGETHEYALACSRYVTSTDAATKVEVLCPADAERDVTVSIDRRRYSVPMCGQHAAEHDERMAARRLRGTPGHPRAGKR